MPTQSESSAVNDFNDIDHASSPETPNQIDLEFESLMGLMGGKDVSQMAEAIKRNLKYFSTTSNRVYNNTVNFINEHKLWGTYYPKQEDYELAENRAYAFVEHREDFKWLYQILNDYRSKRILVNIPYYWLMSDLKRIDQIYDKTFSQYFDLDIVRCSKDEVSVDIRGFIGDTLVSYIQTLGNDCYKKLYCYEMALTNVEYIEENIGLFHIDHIEIKEKGASDRNGAIHLSSNKLSPINQLSESGEMTVPIVKIDDDIEEDVIFIKMDTEGGEERALLDCLEKIKKNHLKLALSVYHNHKDPWKLTHMIYEADPSYHFYLRYYGSPVFPTEYILYAIQANPLH